MKSNFSLKALTVSLLAATAFSATAMAGGSLKDEPAPEGRKLAWSFNIGGNTDYVFRGISQSAEDPAFFAGVDMTYGIFYAGLWGSSVKFGDNVDGSGVATAEIDYYAGIKPVWGPATFDFGVIYYTYPGANDNGVTQVFEQDYVELKAGVSGSIVKNLTTGVTVFWSPDYTGEQGEVTTVEGTVGYELPKFMMFTPTISGTIGGVFGDFNAAKVGQSGNFASANGDDSYLYWNAGIALAVDKLTLDFRYWDTDIANNNAALGTTGFCKGPLFACDERFVFTAKITF